MSSSFSRITITWGDETHLFTPKFREDLSPVCLFRDGWFGNRFFSLSLFLEEELISSTAQVSFLEKKTFADELHYKTRADVDSFFKHFLMLSDSSCKWDSGIPELISFKCQDKRDCHDEVWLCNLCLPCLSVWYMTQPCYANKYEKYPAEIKAKQITFIF